MQDANEILEDLGNPGSLEFQMPDGSVFMTGDMVEDAQEQQRPTDMETNNILYL